MKRFDDTSRTVERHRDDIYTHQAVGMVGVGIEKRGDRPEDAPRFDSDNRFRCRSVRRTGTDTHLHADEYLAIKRDEIKFTAGASPVAGDNPASVALQQMRGDTLPARPDSCAAGCPFCHCYRAAALPTSNTSSGTVGNGYVRAATAAA